MESDQYCELPCVAQSWPPPKYRLAKVKQNRSPIFLLLYEIYIIEFYGNVINSRHFRWYKEEESAVLSSIVIGTNFQQYDGTLIINQVSGSSAGKWVCVANNSLGEEKVIIKLVIISAISVHIEPQRLEVDVGKSATFNCSQRGSPINLPVIWLKDGMPLISDPFNNALTDGRIRLIEANVLHIRSVIREDSGMS